LGVVLIIPVSVENVKLSGKLWWIRAVLATGSIPWKNIVTGRVVVNRSQH
jgi:hypothetical protein